MGKVLYFVFKCTLFFTLIVHLPILISCSINSEQEIYHKERKNIITVHESINEMDFGETYLSNFAKLYLMGDYLIVSDYKSLDNQIYLFDKNNFKLLAETAPHGQGPAEVSNIGHIAIDERNNLFYVTDHGKQNILSYRLDSVLLDPSYKPSIKINMKGDKFPNEYVLMNDSLALGTIMEPSDISGFDILTAEWNLNSGEITPMKYNHPDIKRKRISFAYSKENNIYIESYHHHDLITICELNGDLKSNIYGKEWDSKMSNEKRYFGSVVVFNNRIIISYSGKSRLSGDSLPTSLIVLDINGNYIKTIETGYRILDFICDTQNHRLIFHFDDIIQFGYLSLDGLLD